MRSIGVWLLLFVVFMVITSETDARKTKTKVKVKVIFKKKTSTNGGRRRRSIENIMTLPCDVREYDTDKDDVISRMEWQTYITEFNPELNFAEYENKIIQQLDRNGDGFLQVREFSLDDEYKKDCLSETQPPA
ncbi:uncharacterized protein [Argopecten irradians]